MFRYTKLHQTPLLSSLLGTKRRCRCHNHPHGAMNVSLLHHYQAGWTTRASSSFSSSSSSSSSSSNIPPIAMPTTNASKSWESGAQKVKDSTVQNQYYEHIRDMHDPSKHVKTIEDELKGTIGKALGKQGQKIMMYTKLMEEHKQKYEQLMEQYDASVVVVDKNKNDMTTSTNSSRTNHHIATAIQECVNDHNKYRKDCIQARWELIVHRQAVGFIVGNHQYVISTFPIGEALPEWDGCSMKTTTSTPAPSKKVFGDQLDWWQKVGRWK
jgi:ABC-type uncharacterized transport system substrate-binding protein